MFAKRGSNVTLFCPSPTRTWSIWRNKTVVNSGLLINPNLPNEERLTAINDTTRHSIDLHIQIVTDVDEATYGCVFITNNTDWNIELTIMGIYIDTISVYCILSIKIDIKFSFNFLKYIYLTSKVIVY